MFPSGITIANHIIGNTKDENERKNSTLINTLLTYNIILYPMKPIFTTLILFAIPLILTVGLLVIAVSLFLQHIYHRKRSSEALVFPYLTSWEEVA